MPGKATRAAEPFLQAHLISSVGASFLICPLLHLEAEGIPAGSHCQKTQILLCFFCPLRKTGLEYLRKSTLAGSDYFE
jgi:hypothetical protein